MKVIVADDHPVFRSGICTLVRQLAADAEIVEAADYETALANARTSLEQPALFVLDLFFSRRSIQAELPALRREFPRSAIVVVSMAEDPATVHAVMACGVNGFVNKAIPPSAMIENFAAVLAGDVVTAVPRGAGADHARSLSDRQLQMLKHIADGRSNKEIAQAVGISPFTVRIHVSALFRALDVNSRAAAVTKAVSEGILAPH